MNCQIVTGCVVDFVVLVSLTYLLSAYVPSLDSLLLIFVIVSKLARLLNAIDAVKSTLTSVSSYFLSKFSLSALICPFFSCSYFSTLSIADNKKQSLR